MLLKSKTKRNGIKKKILNNSTEITKNKTTNNYCRLGLKYCTLYKYCIVYERHFKTSILLSHLRHVTNAEKNKRPEAAVANSPNSIKDDCLIRKYLCDFSAEEEWYISDFLNVPPWFFLLIPSSNCSVTDE